MDEQAVIDRILALLPDAQCQAVEGDTFFFWGDDRQIPFATLVTKDAHDAAPVSDLARDGVYRLNVGVGKETYTRTAGPLSRRATTTARWTRSCRTRRTARCHG